MRRPAPDGRPIGLTIAGSDSGGGAGIQADLATMTAGGVYGTSVVTAVTAQHTRGVESSHVLPVPEVEAQIEAVLGDFDVDAAKTGMLATTGIVESVADVAGELAVPLVVDPVMVATSGDRLLDSAAERAYEALIAEATVVTPNADEATVLTGIEVEDAESAREAGERLLGMGADAALVKGGHVPGETVVDHLVTADGVRRFEHPRVDTAATHGSGCTLAAAIVARLARGEPVDRAVAGATDLLARAIRYHYDVGRGPGAVNHAVELRNDAARARTAEGVRGVVDRLAGGELAALVPDSGVDVVGTTPYAESTEDVAAVGAGGDRPPGEVRFGADRRLARDVLEARETAPELRFGATIRFDEGIDAALAELGWPIAARDDGEPFEPFAAGPAALVDREGESTATVFGPSAATLTDRLLALATSVGADGSR